MTNAININIPAEIVDAIDNIAGKRGRSNWIVRQCRKGLKLEVTDENDNPPLAVDAEDYEPKPKPVPVPEQRFYRTVPCELGFKSYHSTCMAELNTPQGYCPGSDGMCPFWKPEKSEQP